MKKRMLFGLLLGALFVYLSIKDIDFENVCASFQTVHYIYIIPVFFIIIFMQFLRSYRWGIILSPVEKIDQLSLFSVTSVGFLAIAAIPARLGELARPYLITNKSSVTMSAALGSIFLERIFDFVTLLFMFFFIALLAPMPSWMVKSSIVFSMALMVILILVTLLLFKREASLRILTPILNKFSPKVLNKLQELLNQFIDGFKMIRDVKLILYVAFLSVFIWVMAALAIYLLFFSFNFNLPFFAAFAVMVVMIVGITIPTAPGFVGNLHYFCIIGLGLFGIPKTYAVSYAIVYHFVSIGLIVILGLVFLPFNRFSFINVKKDTL